MSIWVVMALSNSGDAVTTCTSCPAESNSLTTCGERGQRRDAGSRNGTEGMTGGHHRSKPQAESEGGRSEPVGRGWRAWGGRWCSRQKQSARRRCLRPRHQSSCSGIRSPWIGGRDRSAATLTNVDGGKIGREISAWGRGRRGPGDEVINENKLDCLLLDSRRRRLSPQVGARCSLGWSHTIPAPAFYAPVCCPFAG